MATPSKANNARSTKRGHGEGSIRYDEKRRKWVGKIMLGYRPDGKPDRRTVYGDSRKEVSDKLAGLKAQYLAGTLVNPSRLTVGEFLVGDVHMFLNGEEPGGWLGTHKLLGGPGGDGLRPNTYKQYRNAIKNHILNPQYGIGHIPLQKLTPDHCEELYVAILKKGLSMRSAHVTHQVLRTALEAAVEKKYIPFNPADRVPSKPRVKYRAEDRPWLLRDEAARVLEHLKGTRWYLPFLLAMCAGLRRGEVLGLRWRNVDLDRGVIHVREQLGHDEHGKLVLSPVKTKSSIRDIPIPADVRDLLEIEYYTGGANPDGFVCTNSRGGPLQPRHWNRAWRTMRKKLNLPEAMHPHDLRGSWITWLAQNKVDLKAISRMAGHSDERVTLALYHSVTKKMMEEAAKALEGLTSAASPPQQTVR